MNTLEISHLSKRYGPVVALDDINLSIPAGSRTAIVGHSGSGKTTLLRAIAGFELPDAGTITLGERKLADASAALPAHQRGIGYVPQDGALFPHLTVTENIGFGIDKTEPKRVERIAELMDMVSLDRQMLQRRPHELSGGQQQRVALARAMAQRPSVMLLDEPFSALDTGLRTSTRNAVAMLLSKAGISAILVTHDQAEALSFADQVAVLRDGRLVQSGRPMDLYLRPRDEDVASFLGESIVLPATLAAGRAECALGSIPVPDQARTGPGRILLRPEQITLAPLAGASAQADACIGQVSHIDFSGAMCIAGVEIKSWPLEPGKENGHTTICVRSPAFSMPEIGATVQLNVQGQGHILA